LHYIIKKKDLPDLIMYCAITVLLFNVDYTNSFKLLMIGNTALKLGAVVLVGLLIWVHKKSLYKSTVLLLLGYFMILVSTVIHKRSINDALTVLVSPVGMILLFDYGAKKGKDFFISVIKTILVFSVIVNFVSILLYPNGMYYNAGYTANWVLGYKNAHVRYIVPAIALCVIESEKRSGYIRLRDYLLMLIGMVSCILAHSSTGIVGITVFSLLVIADNNRNRFIKRFVRFLLHPVSIIVMTIALYYVILWGDTTFLGGIIQKYLGRDLTFTGRTFIWKRCFEYISASPITGVGYINSSDFFRLINVGIGSHPHNYLIGILFYGGIASFGFFLMSYVNMIKSFRDNHDYTPIRICLWSVLAFVIMGVSDVLLFSTFFHALIVLIDYYCRKSDIEGKAI